MRNFHYIMHGHVIPTVIVEKLWSLVSEQTRQYYKEHTDKAPAIDVVKAGYMKVCGKGFLPELPGKRKSKRRARKIKSKRRVVLACLSVELARLAEVFRNPLDPCTIGQGICLWGRRW